jgi:hypothetical protein
MSAGESTCELCGAWQDAIRRGKPDDCPRCLRIKEMFLSGKAVREIGKRLGMPIEHLLYVITRLELRGPCPFATCPVCGWQGLIAGHKPSACARNLLARSLSTAGMPAPAIARKLGITRALLFRTTQRLGIKFPPAKVVVCSVCGWRGMSSHHNPERCAYFLQIRKRREAGLPRRVIVRELGISHAMFHDALRRLGLSSKTPK